jgi:hypothetical protein
LNSRAGWEVGAFEPLAQGNLRILKLDFKNNIDAVQQRLYTASQHSVVNVVSQSSFGGCLPELRVPAFFCKCKKALDAVQQYCLTYRRHRKMSFFSTPSFGGYLPEPLVPAFF